MAEGNKLSTCIWAHTDERGINKAVDDAMSRIALSFRSTNLRDALADQRAWFCAVLAAAANVGSKLVTLDESTKTATIQIVPNQSYDRNEEWQMGLLNGLIALIIRREITVPELQIWANQGYRERIATNGGSDAIPANTSGPIVIGVGAAIAIGTAIVASAGILAGALVWINGQDIEKQVVVEQIEGKTQQHAKILETSRDIVESHAERERLEQRTIPWSNEELSYLEFLEQSSREVTGWTAPPLRSVPDAKKMSEAASEAIKDVGSGVKTVSQGVKNATETSAIILPIGIAIALVYFSEN